MKEPAVSYVRECGGFGVKRTKYRPEYWMPLPKTPADGDTSWHEMSTKPKCGENVLVWCENWVRPSQSRLEKDGWFYIGGTKLSPSYWHEMPPIPAK